MRMTYPVCQELSLSLAYASLRSMTYPEAKALTYLKWQDNMHSLMVTAHDCHGVQPISHI